MLIFDGGKYNYIHRTFQEYFAALCVSSSESIDYLEYNSELVSSHRDFGGYISILMDVGRERFDGKYLLPTLKDFVDRFYSIRNEDPFEIVKPFVSEIGIDHKGEIRLIGFGSDIKWRGFETSVLPLIDPRKFYRIFGVVEDVNEFPELNYSTEHDMELMLVDFSLLSNERLVRTATYKHYKNLIEGAKEYLDAMIHKNSEMRRLVSIERRNSGD